MCDCVNVCLCESGERTRGSRRKDRKQQEEGQEAAGGRTRSSKRKDNMCFPKPFLKCFLKAFLKSFLKAFLKCFLKAFPKCFLKAFFKCFLKCFLKAFLKTFLKCLLKVFLWHIFLKFFVKEKSTRGRTSFIATSCPSSKKTRTRCKLKSCPSSCGFPPPVQKIHYIYIYTLYIYL